MLMVVKNDSFEEMLDTLTSGKKKKTTKNGTKNKKKTTTDLA